MMNDLVIGIVSGLISGFVSGIVVWYITYRYTKKKEKETASYLFLRDYLTNALKYCEINFPKDVLDAGAEIFKESESFRDAIQKIEEILHEDFYKTNDLSDKQANLANVILRAYSELERWRIKKKLKY